MASEQGRVRDERIAALERDAAQWAEKLDAQEAGQKHPGKKLSDAGTIARFYKAVADAHLAHIIKVNLASEVFTYEIDERALRRARLMDGKLILVSNVPDSPPAEIVARYKALADIERGFRVLKSEIEIAPVFHRLPDRIRAHALICFLALLLYRVLRLRLKARSPAASSTTRSRCINASQPPACPPSPPNRTSCSTPSPCPSPPPDACSANSGTVNCAQTIT